MSNLDFTSSDKTRIGEILCIAMDSAAMSISTILNKKVAIDSPQISVQNISGIKCNDFIGGLISEISCNNGLIGNSAILVRKDDVQKIINLLLSISQENSGEFEFDELSLGTAQEVINQMVNSGLMSLSEFLGITIDREPVKATVLNNSTDIKNVINVPDNNSVIEVTFSFIIGGVLNTNFVLVLPFELADTISGQSKTEDNNGQATFNEIKNNTAIEEQIEPVRTNNSAFQQSVNGISNNGNISVRESKFPDFSGGNNSLMKSPLLKGNMDLLMDVSLDVAIEIGKTHLKMREVMDFSKGTLISLEKQAGAPVDIVVNGQLIARGDVVVIDDNFGVRITEIIGENKAR
jgi:flagellar motor switch protein FliN/FliY